MNRKRLLVLMMSCLGVLYLQAQNSATGIVKNDAGETLSGVTINLRNPATDFSKTAVSNGKGIFSFSNIPAGKGYSFVISYVGYAADTLTGYDFNENTKSSISVALHAAASSLDQVVVIGYGTMRKKDLSAAVATVPDVEQSKSRAVLDVAGMLQGKVPGITVENDGGHPDRTARVTIRGIGSIQDNVLYVVDGVPNAPYNPADVESITVLKDAASAAIYGAFSGSAGVVLITTKQAKQGNPSVEFSSMVGAKNAWRLPQSLTADKEKEVADLAQKNAGKEPLSAWNPQVNPNAVVTRTDWMDAIFRTGLIQRHNISLNAGTDKFSVLFQGRYEENQGTLINTYAKNISGRFNASYTFSPKIKFRQDLFINNNDSRGTTTESGYTGTILSAIYMPRSATVYYPDGTFGGVGTYEDAEKGLLSIHGDVVNPVATLLRNKPYNKATDIQSVSELKLSDIGIKGLSFISRFSWRQYSKLYKNFTPMRLEPGKPNTSNQLDYSTDKNVNWLWENTLNYNKTIDRHNIGLMASTTAQQKGEKGFTASMRQFDMEADWAQFFINANQLYTNPTDWDTKDRNQSYVGRLSYSWADRYFVTGSYRYDIAGRLPVGNRGQGFPGATAAWKISSEPFFQVDAINLLKIRASWGRIGNLSSIPLYYGYPLLATDITYQVGNGAPHTPTWYNGSAFNKDLRWESSEQKDIGLDLAFLNDRLNITADYFKKRTFDLIHAQQSGWPNSIGFGRPLINQGEIANSGFEFTATYKGNAGKLGYNVTGNFATLKNRVTYIDGNPDTRALIQDITWRGTISPYAYTVGQPYYSYYLVKTAGIFQTDQEAAAYVDKNGHRIQEFAKAGDLKFVDFNGDGKIDDNDRQYMGNAFPKVTYGFNINANWNNFDFNMFWQGVGGVKLFHIFKETTLNAAEQAYNRWDKILGAWSPTNTGSDIPMIRANDPNKNFGTASDWYLENGNYLRLKSVMIGYNIPKLYRTMKLRVYVSADNLITITKYSGMDPEVGGWGFDGGQFPVSRVYAAGFKLTL